MTRLEAARDYLARGWVPLPLPMRSKVPGAGYPTFTVTAAELSRYFGSDGNIGIRVGADSSWLVDVDLDCDEALALADIYLPATGAIFGRASKPRSHRLYVATGTIYEKFNDPFAAELPDHIKSCFLELRSDTAAGGRVQTVFPPSTHDKSGEAIEWEGEAIEPRVIEAALLRRACAWLAVGCLISRYTEGGLERARHPSLAMPGYVWNRWLALGGPVYRWLGIYDPDSLLVRRRHVPEDLDLAGIVALIPNNLDRDGWVRAGLAIYAASGGSDEGKRIFTEFSRRSPRHNKLKQPPPRDVLSVERVWRSFAKSPPRDIGPGSLVWLAAQGACQ